jgi:hypothetical protein
MRVNETMITALKERFEAAGLPLRIAPPPLVRGARARGDPDAMVMDIRPRPGATPSGEVVLLWPGEARLEVPAIDRRLRQLVLHVEEEERTIHLSGRPSRWGDLRVPARGRSLLVGMDECRLFMARLPRRGSSVTDAHEALATRDVRALRHGGATVARQGEYFLIPATHAEIQAIAESLRLGDIPRPGPLAPQRGGKRVTRRGRPHRATETLWVASPRGQSTPGVVSHQFVRGVVSHPDHHPLRLRQWARPEVNMEVQTFFNRARHGVRDVPWVD